ncbi:MAG: NADP-reducing hydrogenase subunit HndC [Candidatus Anoxychlamydiales bacterium]|uniref:Ferredoxin hydrogenase n=1 Tax=marine sediment metagenome TaxID=412755 RepID=A0A0F9MWM8_9ZZZZ|nr:NADP-reducing hydrogenase subunit HndC [Candidatus Anoxychlamydiales bacterium]
MNQKKQINLTIDGQKVTVDEGTSVMRAAENMGVRIPRLCYHPLLSLEGSCRVCIVQIKGFDYFLTSCSHQVEEGMEVLTNSPDIREARRDIVELILDNHPKECQLCERDGNCELQNLAYSMGVRERLFEGKRKKHKIEDSSRSVVRDAEKCILCARCVRVCKEVQGVHNLSQHGRGFDTVVMPFDGANMDDSVCIQCGQCINACPTAAFLEKRHTDRVWKALNDPNKLVIAQTAPSIRAAMGEGFGYEPGTYVTGKMVTALKKLGFDMVFDTNFGADMTIIEESSELIRRLNAKENLPLLTSCSPGWINFMEKFYPELIPNASTCRSPMQMVSALTKTYFAKKIGRDPKDIFMVAVMPCVAKKFEIERPEHILDGEPLTDAVLTTRELNWMIKSYGIEFKKLEDSEFDNPLGESTGGGDIFGTTGGVMEAALRCAFETITKRKLDKVEFKDVRAVEGLRESEIEIDGLKLNVAVANSLTNAKFLLDKIIKKEKQFHIVEIMACPGGCIGGGGQPYPPKGYETLDKKLFALRAKALYDIDSKKKHRIASENESIKTIYKEFLGEPGSELAHKVLHTQYQARFPRGI